MSDPRIASFTSEVEKILNFLLSEYSKLQTGRASSSLVEHLEVDAYGQRQQLKAVAGVTIQDARTIVVQPWDKSIMQNVEKALQQADLGTSPVNDGTVIRINLPPMTEERRTQMTKIVSKLGEEARISVRQQRQHAHDKIKAEENDEDRKFTLIEELEKEVKIANEKIEENMKKKEAELMKV